MAEPKKKYEAETSLPVKLKPAAHASGKPARRDEAATSASPARTGENTERKDLILRIIDYLESI